MNRVTVPVLLEWNHDKVVGELSVDAAALPATPEFTFAIGYRHADEMLRPVLWSLVCACIVGDDAYAKYLAQQSAAKDGAKPASGDGLRGEQIIATPEQPVEVDGVYALPGEKVSMTWAQYAKLKALSQQPGSSVQGEADAALLRIFRAIVDAGGPATIARHGVERGGDAWAEEVRAGMLAIERRFHPERFDDYTPPPAPAAEQPEGKGAWLPMGTAPRDGSLLRLLVKFTEHPIEDADAETPVPTIGSNNFDNTGDDEWQFAGWSWEQDCYTQGEGTPVGWLPMLAAAPAAPGVRDTRQARVHDWCVAAFGDDHAQSLEQRGIRMAEEAIEAAQACGCDRDMLHSLINYVYARPVGELRQELGGVGVTLLALAQAAGLSADDAEADEVARVLSKPLEHFAARNAAKNAAGFNVTPQEPT